LEDFNSRERAEPFGEGRRASWPRGPEGSRLRQAANEINSADYKVAREKLFPTREKLFTARRASRARRDARPVRRAPKGQRASGRVRRIRRRARRRRRAVARSP